MWSDKESSEDYLNFGEVSQLAVDVLTTKDMLPVSIGIFGNWGAGKSSLLKLIEQKLEQDDKDWIVINFDSWLYQGYDDTRAALLEVIATELTKAAEGNSALISKTKRLLSRVDGFRAMKWSTKTGHRVRVFSSIDFPIRLVVTHHYIRAVLVRCNIQRYSPLLRELHR